MLWRIVVEAHKAELCVNHPGRDIDLTIRTDIHTMVSISNGWLSVWPM